MKTDDYPDLILNKRNEIEELNERRDIDRDFYYLVPYQIVDRLGQPVKNIYNVTMPDPKIFMDMAVSLLSSAIPQVIVEANIKELSDTQTTYIEDFVDYLFYNADVRMSARGDNGLHLYECWKSAMRGSMARRVLHYFKGGKVISDITPIDTRWMVHDIDDDGMLWYAYQTTRGAQAIANTYGSQFKPAQSKGVVWDVWDRDKNMVFIGQQGQLGAIQSNTGFAALGQLVKEEKHGYGYVPCVVQEVPAGSQLDDEENISHRCESFYSSARDLFKELNDLLTTLKTISRKVLKPGLTKKMDGSEMPDKYPDSEGAVTEGEYAPFPIVDLKNATTILIGKIEERLSRATLAGVNYGNAAFPMSGYAVKLLQDPKDQHFLPRFQAHAKLNQMTVNMAVRQIEQLGAPIDLGEAGHMRTFHPDKLKGEWICKWKYVSKTAASEMGNYAMAQVAQQLGVPMHTIFSTMLEFENPDGEINKKLAEDAENMFPELKMARYAKALAEQGKNDEARTVMMLAARQAQMGQPGQEQKPGQPQGQSLGDMFRKRQAAPSPTSPNRPEVKVG